MFKMKKVFDCQAMPHNVRDAFFHCFPLGNDSLVTWLLECGIDEEDVEESYDVKLVGEWLYANGADTSDKSVIISHWW